MSQQLEKMTLNEFGEAFGKQMPRAEALGKYSKAVIATDTIELHDKREIIIVLTPEEFVACTKEGDIQVTAADIRSIPGCLRGLVLKNLRTLSFDDFDEDPENPKPAAQLVRDFVFPNRRTIKELVRPTATLLGMFAWTQASIESLVVDGSGLSREQEVENAATRKNMLNENDKQLLTPFRRLKWFGLEEAAENLVPPLLLWIHAEQLMVRFSSVEAAQTFFTGYPPNEAPKHIKLVIDASQSEEDLTPISYDFKRVVTYLRTAFPSLVSCEFVFDMGTLVDVDRNGQNRNESEFFVAATQSLAAELGGLQGFPTTVCMSVRVERGREFDPATDAADTINVFKLIQPVDPQESDVVTSVYQHQRESNDKRLQSTMTFVYCQLPAAHDTPAVECDWTVGKYAPAEQQSS